MEHTLYCMAVARYLAPDNIIKFRRIFRISRRLRATSSVAAQTALARVGVSIPARNLRVGTS
jgi:hypothetical protein